MSLAFPEDEKKDSCKNNSTALTGLFILAVFYTAYFARSVLLPLTLALFFAFLLRPVVRLMRRLWIPTIAGAAIVLGTFLLIAGFAISNLSGPALQWIEKAPQSLQQIARKLEGVISPVKKASKTAEEWKNITGRENEVTVTVGPGLAESVVRQMREFIAQGTIMLILLFFILASGDLFVNKLKKLYRTERESIELEDFVKDIEHNISRYLLTVTVINIAEGVFVALGLYLVGMPDPVLWGVMAALLVYVPYLGPLIGISVVTIVALLTLKLKMALLAFLIYLSVTTLQGQFLTPMILGARFRMNPVVIFVWLILWGTIWGVVGAVMAMPMLTIFKIVCDRIDSLNPVSEFLSD